MTALTGTLQNRLSFSRSSGISGWSHRQTRICGWMPISRSLATLCCVGFVFSSPAALRYGTSVTWMNATSRGPTSQRKLAHRLEERQPLDVPRRAADLGDQHVDAVAGLADPRLDFVGDVRDHLHRLAEIVAAALLLDHRLVDLARGQVVQPRQPARGEPLVVPEIQVGLRAVVEHVDLAVLEGTHGPRIHVEIGIELLDAHPQAPHLEKRAQCEPP